jgi:hypothetical protein
LDAPRGLKFARRGFNAFVFVVIILKKLDFVEDHVLRKE